MKPHRSHNPGVPVPPDGPMHYHPPMTNPGQNLLATMFTTTTFGTWLPGDLRGYVEDGVVLPGDPALIDHARMLMADRAVYLSHAEQRTAFESLRAACAEFGYRLLAASVESWHLHALLDHSHDEAPKTIARLKTRIRQTLDRGRIWTAGYDKRYCFTESQVQTRINYIARHAGHRPLD